MSENGTLRANRMKCVSLTSRSLDLWEEPGVSRSASFGELMANKRPHFRTKLVVRSDNFAQLLRNTEFTALSEYDWIVKKGCTGRSLVLVMPSVYASSLVYVVSATCCDVISGCTWFIARTKQSLMRYRMNSVHVRSSSATRINSIR